MQDAPDSSTTYRLVWVGAVFVLVAILVASLVVILGVPRWFPGATECSVKVDDRTVDLTTKQAQTGAALAARSVRLRLSLRTASVAVADALDIPEGDASVLANALTGRAEHALTCRHGGAEAEESNRLNSVGLTQRAAIVRGDVEGAFGSQKVGGFAPGGVASGHMPRSAHYQGRAVDVFFRPINGKQRTRGWAMAQYLVANADRLEVTTVIFDARIWTSRRAAEGWRGYAPDTSGRSARVGAVLEHRDHVHVDVAD